MNNYRGGVTWKSRLARLMFALLRGKWTPSSRKTGENCEENRKKVGKTMNAAFKKRRKYREGQSYFYRGKGEGDCQKLALRRARGQKKLPIPATENGGSAKKDPTNKTLTELLIRSAELPPIRNKESFPGEGGVKTQWEPGDGGEKQKVT